MTLLQWAERHLDLYGMDRPEQVRAVRDWANQLYGDGYQPEHLWWASQEMRKQPPEFWSQQLGKLQELLRGERQRFLHHQARCERESVTPAPVGYWGWTRAGKPGTFAEWLAKQETE